MSQVTAPKRAGATKPSSPMAWAPWTDKKGRFDRTRAIAFGLLLLPVAAVTIRAAAGALGPRPLNAAIHSTGYWAVVCLVASLAVSPAKAIFNLPHIVVLRRMIGNAALGYALLHLLLYCADQSWHPLTIVMEIAKRFYLTIGLVALIGLAVLGATSTDEAIRRMGARWKRLHKLAYGIAVLTLFHFILQTKADVSVPLLFVGIFIWLMVWRQVPVGRDRSIGGLLVIGVTAAALTLVTEYLWYRFGTNIDPAKVLLAETDVTFGFGPTDMVLLGGLFAAAGLALRRASQGPWGDRAIFWVVLFAAGAALNEVVVFVFGIDRFLEPGDWSFLWQDFGWAALLGVLGFLHWRRRGSGEVLEVDALAVCCIAYQITRLVSLTAVPELVLAAAIVGLWAVLAWQTWRETKLAALGLLPLAALLAYGVNAPV